MLSKIIITALLTLSATTFAQTTGSIFALEGSYIKIGVSDYGTIGSKGNASPGIMYDNTGTRTFNSSYDYLTPGAPFEGFTIKATASGTPFSVTNNNMSGGSLTGVLTNYSGIAYSGETFDNRAVWVSTNNANFDLTNDVRFNNSQKFVDITSKLSAKVAMTDVYFARFIDPDARAAAGDSSATTNTLGYSPIPATNVVFSEALASKYALGLYSGQVGNVGTGISSSWSTDPITYFTGTNGGNGDYTIGIAFKVDSMGVGDLATFKYAYIFGPSTLTAGAYAVSSGAGGGTAGVVPGCTSGCEMEGVTPSTPAPTPPSDSGGGEPAPPPAPTVVSSSVDYLYSRLSVFNRQPAKKVLGIRNTITESTTPFYTDIYSDGSSVSSLGAASVSENVAEYQTRVDQYNYLQNANQRFNQLLNSNVYDRYNVNGSSLFSRSSNANSDTSTYINAEGMQSNTYDSYKMDAQRFGFGHEKKVLSNWVLGAQFNYVSATMKGDNAGGSLIKNHVGIYSLFTLKDWILKSDLGVSLNNYKNNHSLNSIEELGPLYNAGSTSGRDMWFSNRLYTPSFFSFRPFAGVTAISSNRGAVNESGPILTSMSYDKYNQTSVIGEAGLRYDNKVYGNLGVIAEVGQTTNNITYGKVGVNYKPSNSLYTSVALGQQRQEGVTNNIIQANIKIAF
jgi:hypothetical protein